MNKIKDNVIRLNYVKQLSYESTLLGMTIVNSMYLAIWVFVSFGLLRYYAGIASYFISTVIASYLTLTINE